MVNKVLSIFLFPHMVHLNNKITSVFTVPYLEEMDIDVDNHKLNFCRDDYTSLSKNLSEENWHITTTKREVLNYDSGQLVTKDTCEELLAELGNIDEVRYIVLTCKSSLNGSKRKL